MSTSGPLGRSRPSAILTYGIAALVVVTALIAGRLLEAFLDIAPFVSLFLCGIMFAAWFGGTGPGLLAAALGVLAFTYYFVPPFNSLVVEFKEIPRIALFAVAALFVVTLSGAQRRATDALRRTRDELRDTVRRLEGLNESLQAENAERKRAEQRSREAEQELQMTIDTIPALAARYRANGSLDFVNQTWRNYTGLSQDSLKGQRWGVAIHPDDLPEVEKQWRTHLAAGEAFQMEHRLQRADGEYRWHWVRRVPLRDEHGGVIKWYGVGFDIEDQKRAEAALRLSEAHLAEAERELRLTIDRIPTLAWHTRPDGFAEYLNKRWLDYTGLTLEQGLGWKWQVAIHPDDLPGLTAAWQKILAAGKPAEVEARLRRFDGEYRWFLFRPEPLLDASGNVVRWYGTNTDIEDRKRAEDALRRSEAYLAEAQRLSRTGSFGWKIKSGDIVLSSEAYRIMDVDPMVKPTMEVLLGRVHPDDRELVQHHIERARQGEQAFDYENRVLMPDGTVKHIHVRAHRVQYETGEEEIIGALVDITATKAAQEALQVAQAELAHASRVANLGEMSASIAHEVNQPLAAIVTNGQASMRWLTRQAPDIEEALSAVSRIVDEANRATRVIQRIRDFSKKAKPEMLRLDINDLIEEALALVQHEALNHRVALRPEFAPGLPAVRGDRVQLQQVIINLAVNGIQAMATVSDRARVLVIRTQQHKCNQILVAVQDAGVGMPPENLNRLFNAFYTTKANGMGMGLSICRSIIEAHGGQVWASYNSGAGMTFQFTVSAAEQGADAAA